MGNCAIKQWRLTVQQSYKNIPCFSTCCKGEINVQIISDNGEDLEPGVLRSNSPASDGGKEAVYKATKALHPKLT